MEFEDQGCSKECGQGALSCNRQLERYNRLFQSVLCGIVHYSLLENGNVVFKEANLEAIRIFGYEPDEFWSIKEWDMGSLIVEEDREWVLFHMAELVNVGDKNSYEYRLRQKNGKACWIVGSAEIIQDEDGEVLMQSVFLDIDKNKRTELQNKRLTDQVEEGKQLLKLALAYTSTYEYYYYPLTRSAVVPDRTADHYGLKRRYTELPESLGEDLVDGEGREAYFEMHRKIRQGDRTASAEVRFHPQNIWCRITMSTVRYTEMGEPSYVVGLIEDITKTKEMENALEDARSRDHLTGLYRKEAGLANVKRYMETRNPKEPCTMMLLDMDNFEAINVEEGHVFADAVLQDVAAVLVSSTKKEDIRVRLGGDEYLVFVKNCDKDQATVIGPAIAARVQSLYGNEGKSTHVSVSIGMCASSVVNEYAGLYRCAESALLYVKEHGKGQAACYLEASNEVGTALTQIYRNEHIYNEIDSKEGYQERDMLDFALDLLGKSKKLSDAILLLLGRMGKKYDFDRVSILEANQEYLSYQYTYQWVKINSDSQVGLDFYVSQEKYNEIISSYNSVGLCESPVYGNGMMESCLHAAVWNEGVYAGSLIFEKKESGYRWDKEQRLLVKEMAKLFSSFIMKARADAISKAKTDFLSRMSHEIRTPMNAISGMTSIAKTVLDSREKTLECLNKIESANQYLLLLINDILDMSKIESGKMELFLEDTDFNEYLEELRELMLPQAEGKHLTLEFNNEYKGARTFHLDPLRLNQVLINMIGNAVKFTREGGSITLSVRPVEEYETGLKLLFSVRDTGIGIKKENLNRIFNAFDQGGRSGASQYGGTGLGLSISGRLIQMMGGKIEVVSEVDQGSEFFFTIPLEYGGEADHSREKKKAGNPKNDMIAHELRGMRILIAEDNPINQEIAVTILNMNGFQTETAWDGREAVTSYLSHDAGYYNGILMDIRMPVMDGLEATRKIRTSGRKDSRSIPIIATTANAFDEDSRKSIASGMNGHLTKPIVISQLIELLNSCLNSGKQ